MTSSFYDTTRKRLEAYGVFGKHTLDFVAEKASAHAKFTTYEEFFRSVGMPLEPTLFVDASGRGIYLVDIEARARKEEGAIVVHLPMNNSLDTNQLYQVAWLAYLYPQYRVIAFGNPSGRPFALREQRFSAGDWAKVSFTKNRRAVVSTELAYIESQGISNTIHIGFSYGAMKALLFAHYAPKETVGQLILLDPVSHPRNPVQLLKDFNNTSRRLAEYVDRTGIQTFLDARGDAAQTVDFNGGLLGSANIAIGLMIARMDFNALLKDFVLRNDTARVYVAWGSESELADGERMQMGLERLKHEAGARLEFLELKGDSHAFANDIHEYGAIVNEALAC